MTLLWLVMHVIKAHCITLRLMRKCRHLDGCNALISVLNRQSDRVVQGSALGARGCQRGRGESAGLDLGIMPQRHRGHSEYEQRDDEN